MRKQPLLVAALLGVVILGSLYVLRADAGRAQTPTSGIQGPYSGTLVAPTRVDLRAVQPGRPGGNHVRFLGRAEAGSAASLPLAPSAPSAPSAAVAAAAPATLANFDGIGNGVAGFTVRYAPPDANAAVGPNHVVEVVNTSYAIYSKAGALLAGPTPTNTLWAGFGGPCETDNDGDGSAVYDQIADRWVIMQFAITTSPFELCVAVSQTADPAGPYFRYAFGSTNFPDYPKLAVWPDGYYVTTNDFNPAGTVFLGASIHVLDRAKMLAGLPATQQVLGTGPNFGGLLASTLDGGTLPPAGVPSTILALDTTNRGLAYWKLSVDWANPSLTTLTGPITLPAAPFTLPCGDTGGVCVPQAGTRQLLDTLGDRLMYRLAYRNFGDHESLVVNHSVEVTSNPAVTRDGIRWYELRIDASRNPSIFQQGTYAPDASYRWMGSVAMDAAGGIGLGFSLSSSVRHPEIHVTGRVAGDPAGQMPQGETTIIAGAGSQTVRLNRWGDYSSMAVDPADGCTFWYTQEYIPANGTFNWRTRIGSFRLPSCGAAPTPTSTATPTPTATNTATPTPTNTAVPTATSTPTSTPSNTPTPTNTPVPPTSTPTNTPTPTDTPTTTPTPTSTSTNTPSSTPTPADTPTDTATPTPIPTNTLVPPTATPTQSVASVGGIAEEVDPATLPSATSAASGSDRNVYGFAGVVGVLAVAAAGGWATWRRRRRS